MIDKENFHVLNYVKKEEYSGSMEGMRYMLRKKAEEEEVKLEVIIWPEPFGYAKTPESKKQRMDFELTPDGMEKAIDWMNEQYEKQLPLWKVTKRGV